MENKEKLIAKEIGSVRDALSSLEKENKELADKIVQFQQSGLKAEEAVKEINKEFKDAVKNSTKSTDLDGKYFFIKEAKLGDNSYETNVASNVSIIRKDNYSTLSSFFGEEVVNTDTVKHTFFQGRSILKKNGKKVPECEEGDEKDFNYKPVKFGLGTYTCEYPSSIKYLSFVSGGGEAAINSLILDTKNSIAQDSLNADNESEGEYGLFNVNTDRTFDRINPTGTNGAITSKDLVALQSHGTGDMLNSGAYIMPNRSLTEVKSLSDNNGRLIFIPETDAINLGTFNLAGNILGRPVIMVNDDVWDNYTYNYTKAGAAQIFYGMPEAFQYYSAPTDEYEQYVNDLFTSGGMLIQVNKDTENPGCIRLITLALNGYGVTDPTAGVILQQPLAISSDEDSITYAEVDSKTYGDLTTDLNVVISTLEGTITSVDYTFESPDGTSVDSGDVIPVGENQPVTIIATTNDLEDAVVGIKLKLKVFVTVTPTP